MADAPERIKDQSVITEMQDSYLTYAMSVIMSRALPDARDGLKPSQRRILIAMHDLKLGPRSQTVKCASIVGECMKKYHPHGEQVIYPTLVRMGQTWNTRGLLIKAQGNFGSIDGDPPAAMRYTEARLGALASEMLVDLELDTVDFVDTYDGTHREPSVLPGKFPNLLVNGGTGIAVGMATNMAPHNLGEICDAVVACIDRPDLSLQELMTIVPGPDFPTGGEICGRRGIVDAYTRGRGALVLRGKVHGEEKRGGRRMLVITEIPYQVVRSTLVEKIAAAVKHGNIKGVSAVNDASDRNNPLRIEVDLRKDGNEDLIIRQLFEYTPLQSSFNIANVALVGRQPKTLGLREMLDIYIDHRREVVRRRTDHLVRKAKQRAHILEGLILAVGDIDTIIKLIRESKDPKIAKDRLMDHELTLGDDAALRQLLPEAFVQRASAGPIRMSAVQASAILSMQLQRLTGLEVEKLAAEYSKIVGEIKELEAILADEGCILAIVREDAVELKNQFADPRRTEIVEAVGDYKIEELIPDEQVVVTLSHEGYIKRTDPESYRKQGRGGRGIRGGATREGDFLEHLFVVSTHDYLLFFTNRGRVYWARVFDLPSLPRTARGRSIVNLLQFQTDETHRAVLAVKQFEEVFVFFATAKGVVKKTPLAAFSRPRPSGIIALSLDDDDDLIGVPVTQGNDEIVLSTRDGMAIRFNEENVRAMGRTARGVRGMTLKGDDVVVDIAAIQPGSTVLTICENGYGKRTPIDDYRLTKRGAQGVINIKTTERNGRVVAVKAVEDDDELMIITAKGIMLRTDLKQIRAIGRNTQGVRLIRVDEGDKVVAVAKIPKEDNNNKSNTETAADADSTSESSADDPGSPPD